MLSRVKWIFYEYWPLFMKMALDAPTMGYDLLCDVEILLSLVCFIPMLEIVNSLVKFAQLHNVLFMTLWQQWKFVKLISKSCIFTLAFNNDGFRGFHGLLQTNHDDICMKWVTNLNIKINHLKFELNGQHIWAKHKNMETIVNAFVIYDIYFVVVTRWRRKLQLLMGN